MATACHVSISTRGADDAKPQGGAKETPYARPATHQFLLTSWGAYDAGESWASVEQRERERKIQEELQRHLHEEARQKAIEEDLVRRHPVPEAVGTFEWHQAIYDRERDTEYWAQNSLSITIGEEGAVGWSAFSNAQVVREGEISVPTNCGTDGEGQLEEVDGDIRLVTIRRGKFGGGGTPGVVAIWKCGSLEVRTPLDWKPTGNMRCNLLGSEPDEMVERASEAACAHVTTFPELDKSGAKLTVEKDSLTLARKNGEMIKLKRRVPTQTPKANP